MLRPNRRADVVSISTTVFLYEQPHPHGNGTSGSTPVPRTQGNNLSAVICKHYKMLVYFHVTPTFDLEHLYQVKVARAPQRVIFEDLDYETARRIQLELEAAHV